MKVIFLDIDGVLNVNRQEHDKYGSLFHDNFVNNLRHIIDKTDAVIVISSSWRHSGFETMCDMWEFRNLPGKVIDITPCCVRNVMNGHKELSFYERCERGNEIQEWLDNHNYISNYVILDDDADMLEEQMPHFVMTSKNKDHEDCIDIGYGLTRKCAEKAIEILNSDN